MSILTAKEQTAARFAAVMLAGLLVVTALVLSGCSGSAALNASSRPHCPTYGSTYSAKAVKSQIHHQVRRAK